jgi:hypothetical protein
VENSVCVFLIINFPPKDNNGGGFRLPLTSFSIKHLRNEVYNLFVHPGIRRKN